MASSLWQRPLAPPCLCLIAGIMGQFWLRDCGMRPWMVVLTSLLFSTLAIKRRPSRVLICLIFISIGAFGIYPWVVTEPGADHVSAYIDGQYWQISGQLIRQSHSSQPNRSRWMIGMLQLDDARQRHDVSGRIQLTLIGAAPEWLPGDRIQFRARLKPFRNFNNPGGFDYRQYMAFQGMYARAYASVAKVQHIDRVKGSGFFDQAARVRMRVLELIDQAAQGDSGAVLKALVAGDRTDISLKLRNQFNRTGLGHLLAISGLHIGIVCSLAYFAFKWLLCWVRPWSLSGQARKIAAMLTLIPLFGYVSISGWSPSTQRAAIMAACLMLTFLLERELDALNTLAAAALILLLWRPPALFSISFQLSFVAVLSIVVGLKRFVCNPPTDQPWYGWITYRLGQLVMVSLLAIAGTLPLTMHYFNQISFIGPISNLVMVPWIGYVVTPVGLAGALVSPLSEPAARMAFDLAATALAPALALIHFGAAWPAAAAYTITPNLFEIGCYYLLLGTLLAPSVFGKPRMLMAVAVAMLIADVGWWRYQRFGRRDLRITVIDVGQGSAALVEFPRGHTMLIDGGGFADNQVFDVGYRIVAPLLWQKKIATVDTLVLSHPDRDHLNGLLFVAEHFHVRQLLTNGQMVESRAWRNLMKSVERRDIDMPAFDQMARHRQVNGVDIDILHPPHVENPARFVNQSDNDRSLVLKLTFGQCAILFPGDIESSAEQALVASAGHAADSQVLVAPHHGSKTSSSAVLLDAVTPEWVVVSCRGHRRLRVPHPIVLARYQQHGCRVFRTDWHGALALESDGSRWRLTPYLGPAQVRLNQSYE